MNKITPLMFAIASLAGVMVFNAMLSGCEAGPVSSTPAGFDKYLVFMAAGVYDQDDPDYVPPNGAFFHKTIMGRDKAVVEQERARAIAFFDDRFGIDITTDSGVEFQSFMRDPRAEYRAYTISGEMVGEEGWVVRDGGFRIDVVAPDGIVLGGAFSGEHVPQGTKMMFGDYNIRVSEVGKNQYDPSAIIIHYETSYPIIPGVEGSYMFRHDLYSRAEGTGMAQGIVAPQFLQSGLRQANIRNVLTFPSFGPSRVTR